MTHSGGKPHTNVGDTGQRYEFRYYDDEGKVQVFGWGNTPDAFLKSMRSCPWTHKPFVVDRQATNQIEDQPTKEKL